nr:uncharacterized protein LOC109747744 [Aegilops tauschii subsp. strangulata]
MRTHAHPPAPCCRAARARLRPRMPASSSYWRSRPAWPLPCASGTRTLAPGLHLARVRPPIARPSPPLSAELPPLPASAAAARSRLCSLASALATAGCPTASQPPAVASSAVCSRSPTAAASCAVAAGAAAPAGA